MKKIIFVLVIIFAFALEMKAQSDNLVINLKNNQAKKIVVTQIQIITFKNINNLSEMLCL